MDHASTRAMDKEIVSMKRLKNQLLMFSLSMGDKEGALGHVQSWAIEMSRYFDETILVVTRDQSKTNCSEYFQTIELGGGSVKKRTIAIFRLAALIPLILRNRKELVVFHHMSTYPLYILGPLIRICGIKQILWYSHSMKAKFLGWGLFWVNFVLSPTKETFPISSKKVIPTNHGVNFRPFHSNILNQRSKSILVVGRVAPIKKIEQLLIAISNLPIAYREVRVIGYEQDPKYLMFLRNMAKELDISISFEGVFNEKQLNAMYRASKILFTGTPRSIDKVSIECATQGCIPVTTNQNVHQIINLREWCIESGLVDLTTLSIQAQIDYLFSVDISEEFREKLGNFAYSKNSLEALCATISGILRG